MRSVYDDDADDPEYLDLFALTCCVVYHFRYLALSKRQFFAI